MTSGWTLAPTPTLWSNVRCRTYTTEFRLSASTVPEGDTYSATTAASVTLPAVIRVPAWTPPEPEPEPEPLGQNATFWTHALAEALDLDPVEVQPVVEVRTRAPEGWVVDEGLSAALAGYTIRYGRSEASSDTPPMTASLTLATDLMATSTPTIGTQVQVGLCEPVATALGLTADQAIRFTGEVTDPTVDYRARLTTLTCTGRLGRLNRLPVDGTSWPVEDDATRVFRVLLALTNLLPVEFGDFDLGTYDVAPPDTVAPAATLLATTAASVVGQLVEQPTGHLDWQGADHRRGQVAHVALSAAAVFRAVSWSQRLADLVNLAEVKYATGAVQVGDAASADPATGYGPYSASVDTALVDEDDAYAIGTQYVARRSVPAWRLPDLQVDLLRTIALEQLPDVLTLRHGDKVALTGLPGECPLPEHVFAEGWTETATPRAWRLVLPVSDPIQSGVGLRWIDVPPTPEYRWADVDPTRTWLSAVRTENPADLT